MTVLTALAVAIVFGVGIQLMGQSDIIKLAAGTLLISNAAVLLLVSAGFGAHEAPLLPVENPQDMADPLVQALALTAVVIGFGSTILLLRVILAMERTHDTIELSEMVTAEIAEDPDRGKDRAE